MPYILRSVETADSEARGDDYVKLSEYLRTISGQVRIGTTARGGYLYCGDAAEYDDAKLMKANRKLMYNRIFWRKEKLKRKLNQEEATKEIAALERRMQEFSGFGQREVLDHWQSISESGTTIIMIDGNEKGMQWYKGDKSK